jgi:hypothetical protein
MRSACYRSADRRADLLELNRIDDVLEFRVEISTGVGVAHLGRILKISSFTSINHSWRDSPGQVGKLLQLIVGAPQLALKTSAEGRVAPAWARRRGHRPRRRH